MRGISAFGLVAKLRCKYPQILYYLIGKALSPLPTACATCKRCPTHFWCTRAMEKQQRDFYSSFASRNPSLAPAGAVIREDRLCATQPIAKGYSHCWFPSATLIFHHRDGCCSSPFGLQAETIFTPNPGDVPCPTVRAPGWSPPALLWSRQTIPHSLVEALTIAVHWATPRKHIPCQTILAETF